MVVAGRLVVVGLALAEKKSRAPSPTMGAVIYINRDLRLLIVIAIIGEPVGAVGSSDDGSDQQIGVWRSRIGSTDIPRCMKYVEDDHKWTEEKNPYGEYSSDTCLQNPPCKTSSLGYPLKCNQVAFWPVRPGSVQSRWSRRTALRWSSSSDTLRMSRAAMHKYSLTAVNLVQRLTEWDVGSTKTFIDLCIEQIYKKERLGSSFTKDGWNHIIAGFKEKTCLEYTKKQLKNRLDSLRREWKAWEKLFLKETGIAIDYARNMVIAKMNDDVYRPQMDLQESSSDSEEWLQGTNAGGSVQVPADLEGMNLTSNTQPCAPSGSTSIGKRKRVNIAERARH
ncbi:hypothetical protein K1719_027776 [Acacia pycnantha]|nr:hypothetical protein K1719_027776 [Acacia pycnantha]